MNCCLQNTLHINLHILLIIYFKDKLKIQESLKSNKYIKSYQENMIEFWIIYFYFYYKVKIGFPGECS